MNDVALNTVSVSTTVQPANRLDAVEAVELRGTLEALVESGSVRIIVDLRQCEFVDSAGLAALVKYMKDTRAVGGDLRVVRPRSKDAQRVFSLTKFDEVFAMADDVADLDVDW